MSSKVFFLQEVIDLIKAAKRETKIPIIANVFGAGRNLDGWSMLARECEKAGADALELNFSCPNVGILQKKLEMVLSDKVQVTDAEIEKYIVDNKITGDYNRFTTYMLTFGML